MHLLDVFRYAVSLWLSRHQRKLDWAVFMGPRTARTLGSMQFMLNRPHAVTVLHYKPSSLWQSFLLSSSEDVPSMVFSHSFGVDRVETAVMFSCCGPSILRFVWLKTLPLPSLALRITVVLNCFCRRSCQLEQILSISCHHSWQRDVFVHTFRSRRCSD